VERKPWTSRLVWVFPVLAALFAGWLVYRNWREHGPTIHIEFTDASGVQDAKTTLRSRGAKVGQVLKVYIAEGGKNVIVEAQLTRPAANLAREGAVFWIVRPRISLEDVQGLNTIVSGEYIEVKGGTGEPRTEFAGVEDPSLAYMRTRGLEVVLLAPTQGSVARRSPISYRGVKVGEVTGTSLSEDSRAVAIRAWIAPRYVPLVGPDSKFWNAGGVDIDVGLLGASINLASLKSLVTGAIEFATPHPPSAPVPAGMVFRLYEKTQADWLGWTPAIALDPRQEALPEEAKEPPLRETLKLQRPSAGQPANGKEGS
jgi:paraquat-inducible protein B